MIQAAVTIQRRGRCPWCIYNGAIAPRKATLSITRETRFVNHAEIGTRFQSGHDSRNEPPATTRSLVPFPQTRQAELAHCRDDAPDRRSAAVMTGIAVDTIDDPNDLVPVRLGSWRGPPAGKPLAWQCLRSGASVRRLVRDLRRLERYNNHYAFGPTSEPRCALLRKGA